MTDAGCSPIPITKKGVIHMMELNGKPSHPRIAKHVAVARAGDAIALSIRGIWNSSKVQRLDRGISFITYLRFYCEITKSKCHKDNHKDYANGEKMNGMECSSEHFRVGNLKHIFHRGKSITQ